MACAPLFQLSVREQEKTGKEWRRYATWSEEESILLLVIESERLSVEEWIRGAVLATWEQIAEEILFVPSH